MFRKRNQALSDASTSLLKRGHMKQRWKHASVEDSFVSLNLEEETVDVLRPRKESDPLEIKVEDFETAIGAIIRYINARYTNKQSYSREEYTLSGKYNGSKKRKGVDAEDDEDENAENGEEGQTVDADNQAPEAEKASDAMASDDDDKASGAESADAMPVADVSHGADTELE